MDSRTPAVPSINNSMGMTGLFVVNPDVDMVIENAPTNDTQHNHDEHDLQESDGEDARAEHTRSCKTLGCKSRHFNSRRTSVVDSNTSHDIFMSTGLVAAMQSSRFSGMKCVACRESFGEAGPNPVQVTCGHVFCEECAKPYFMVHNSCPIGGCHQAMWARPDGTKSWAQAKKSLERSRSAAKLAQDSAERVRAHSIEPVSSLTVNTGEEDVAAEEMSQGVAALNLFSSTEALLGHTNVETGDAAKRGSKRSRRATLQSFFRKPFGGSS